MSRRFIPGIASQSLGNPSCHGIKGKLQAAADAGLESIEIFFEDINQLAQAYRSSPSILSPRFQPHLQSGSEKDILIACASQIGQWCRDTRPHSLEVICLQPFMHYEGLMDRNAHQQRLEKLDLWIQIAKALGTDLIQIPSNFLSSKECTGDRSRIVADLREVAEIGARQTPPIRFAHEALCWGTHTDTWDVAWEIVQAVDMDNFGTCLDTFNIAGRVYADPTRPNGKNASADTDIAISMQKLRDTFSDPKNLKKVFYVELCDGEVLDAPLTSSHPWYNAEQPARMTWSRNARLFAYETDAAEATEQHRGIGYLPLEQIFDALLDVGYEGHISFEVFNRSLNEPEPGVVGAHSHRAKKSWERCARHIQRREEKQFLLRASEQMDALVKGLEAETRSLGESSGQRGGTQYQGIASRL